MLIHIDNEEAKNLLKNTKKDGLVFANRTKYFVFYINNIVVGVCGVILNKNKIIFKNDYVFKEYRGNRYGEKMLQDRLRLFKKNFKIAEATCTKMSIKYYLENGFKVVKTYKNSCVKVRYENI